MDVPNWGTGRTASLVQLNFVEHRSRVHLSHLWERGLPAKVFQLEDWLAYTPPSLASQLLQLTGVVHACAEGPCRSEPARDGLSAGELVG